jgi:mRNA-degrading endonuclease YafQ of YafQ-DinJ toxin-antitoxin module
MPTIILTDPFKKDFLKLSTIEQSKKSLRFLADNPKHPSLQIHKIKGTIFWEAYVNKDIRIVFEQTSDTLTLMAIGHHDILKKY